ncbi:MAG: CRISPR-associated protein Cas4 [Burkholderiales bacterium]
MRTRGHASCHEGTSLSEVQKELSLPFPELSGDLPLLPARMVNEYQYCPRLAYLEWVQGEWAESSDTVEGRYAHRRVDRPSGDLPAPEEAEQGERVHARSITLSSNRLGLIAKMDLVEGEGDRVTPVDYKRGKRPHVPQGAYEPERVQLCVQGLILEEHADSSVIQAINNGEIRPTDFLSAAGSVALTADGRKRFIATFERRLSQEVTHPLFGYKLSYRRLLELQSRVLRGICWAKSPSTRPSRRDDHVPVRTPLHRDL